ncbi:MAG: Gfo/Idh/MocA family protein [Gemmatimonadaceae bacterium]
MTAPARHGVGGPRRSPVGPRLGFLGTGWIGQHRLRAIAASGIGTVCAVADSSAAAARAACEGLSPAPRVSSSLPELLDQDLDGIVIATPSALHAEQSIAALEQGLAVFCQKPLARTTAETRRVVDAACRADRLLAVDLSYRFTAGMTALRELVRQGELGEVFAVEAVFHNAYGPDKEWFRDMTLSGGGCVIDLGSHLVDLALWTLDFPVLRSATSRLYSRGQLLRASGREVEDYATARLDLETGATIQLTCSWNLPAGCDAVISATFYGSKGGASFHNVGGSFYDFVAERFSGTSRERLVEPPDEWGGRAAVDWARRLAAGATFDPAAAKLVDVATAIDRIYGR